MGTLQSAVKTLDEKVQESFFKRSKSMVRLIDFPPQENWFLGIGSQLLEISKIVSDAVLAIYPNGGTKQYIDAIVFELAGYQIKNIKTICDYAVKNYDDSKALPTLPFWLRCITAVKSQQPSKNSYTAPLKTQISKQEQAEVAEMMIKLGEQIGASNKTEGAFSNKTTLIRHYGILQNLNKGLVQVLTEDGKDYEWVEPFNAGNRKHINHDATREMFVSGRIRESEAKKVFDKFNGGRDEK
jgi:hypothetical protein